MIRPGLPAVEGDRPAATQTRTIPSPVWPSSRFVDMTSSSGSERPEAAVDADETRFRPSGAVDAADQETRYRPGADQPTRHEAPATDTDSKPAARSGPTGPSWGDPSQWAAADARPLQPGDVVKDRFVLEDIIGKGGMGVVFRVRDLRKEEAQDRHPYAALKVLGEDFKRHPESLKALQREARKAQNLAHPNIVTVYDFDRDGAHVYMVMELLEGEPLDRFIKRLDKGLPIGEALPIVRALCAALSYAHGHGVVHSDFKPANAYVTRNGAIKVFDFGIARAAKRPGDVDATGSLTLFDPGTLGALTPAYASCEMLDGLEPDPRDDVYALGCVAYELLTGVHPFERKSAVQARSAALKPKPIRGLTGRQWRALRRSLAFERDARTPSIDKFLEEISPTRRPTGLWIGAAAAAILIATAAALLLPGYLQGRRANELAALVRSGTPQAIQQALPGIAALPGDVRATMLLDDTVRSALIGDFNSRIETATAAARGRYDYPQAQSLLAELQQLFPDSQAVSQIGEKLAARKNDEIKRQSDRFDDLLLKGWLIERQNADNIAAVLAVIAQIDPQHPLLADPRLPSAYAEQAQLALRQSDIALAQALTQAGLAVAPSDATLQDLNDVAGRQLDAQRRATQLADLRRRLTQELPNVTALAAFDSLHRDVSTLYAIEPSDPGLRKARERLQELLDKELQPLVAQRSFDKAQDLVAQYADLAAPGYIEAKRVMLESERGRAGVTAASADAVAGLKAGLDELLKQPQSNDDWDARVASQLAKLSAYLAPTDQYLAGARQTVAASFVEAAAKLRSQGRLSEAERSLERAQARAPGLAAIAAERQQLERMRAEQDARDKEQKRLAELAALKQKLQDQATANEVEEATATLRDLRASLPAGDPFLSTAAKAIAAAHVRLAAVAAREGRLESAVASIDRALELDRGNAQVATLRAQYVQQQATQKAATANNEPAAPAVASPTQPASQPATGAKVESTPQPASQAPVQAASTAAATAVSTTAPGATCSASLAGYGTRSRGVCFDPLPRGRGPDLVVVPAGGAVARPFAIGRFEVSVAEYAAFCQASGKCSSPGGPPEQPITSLPVGDAAQYAQWLSAGSGFVYRLPTEAEWLYAASAPGGGERDFNCVVELNGQKIRGFGLGSVRSGRPNGWGLFNLVGNAQEWVTTAQGWGMRGGAYSDPISQCSAQLSRSSAGAADVATGFRLVRELR